MKDEEIIKRLEKFGKKIKGEIKDKKSPTISLPVRSASNVNYNEEKGILRLGDKEFKRHFFNISHAKKFMQTLLVAKFARELLKEDKTASIRDLYYNLKHTIEGTNENTFEEQDNSNPVIEDLEVALNVLREQLNLRAKRKGRLIGNITIIDAGDEIDCRKGRAGFAIPSKVEPGTIDFKDVNAEYALVIEKDAVFTRLAEDEFWQKENCLLITGGGMPSRGVRRLVNRLHNEEDMPIYCFTDADPWGYYIYSVYKQGSINLAFLSDKLGTPNVKFVGLTTQDKEEFGLKEKDTIKLNEQDKKRAKDMLEYEWFQVPEWEEEIEYMLEKGFKMEQEALSSRGLSFVSEEYLPTKIENKDFLP